MAIVQYIISTQPTLLVHRFYRNVITDSRGATKPDLAIKLKSTGDFMYLELQDSAGSVVKDSVFGLSSDAESAAALQTTYDVVLSYVYLPTLRRYFVQTPWLGGAFCQYLKTRLRQWFESVIY